MSIGTPLDSYLDRLTMHRVTLFALLGLILWALGLSLLNVLHYSALDIAGAAILAAAVGLSVNAVLARVLRATTNPQSTLITALLLALIVPIGLGGHWVFLAAASVAAVASKYMVTVDKQHLFNPAAVALVALALLFPDMAATWWVGTAAMLPGVVLFGAVVMLKTRRTGVVLTFLAVSLCISAAAEILDTGSVASAPGVWRLSLVQAALLFFALFMMTDPITIPSPRLTRNLYVGFLALLYTTPELRFLPLGFTPEQALCLGNVVSFLVRPKYRLSLPLKGKYRAGEDTWVFAFGRPQQRFAFAPGQFMEWTVPHAHPDGRGQRRYFTITSSPTEGDVSIAMRVPWGASSFKRALAALPEGSPVTATRLAGDFVLPKDLTRPLVFIGGGVGVAPFRSMAQHIVDKGIRCDIVLLYSCRKVEDVLFADTFAKAGCLGLRSVYLLTDREAAPAGWKGRAGRVTAEVIKEEAPDFKDRLFFLSGSQAMVQNMERVVRSLGVPRSRVRRDYFDGSVDG
ncbi:MAG: FAD-dependent oxidoreductase [Chloroflexi bacterium]|nr:FAD-dependent oxidoreductase [Chloroflexota bacterium]